MATTKDEKARIAQAFKWLVTVRRAEIGTTESAAYLAGLGDLPGWAVERACGDIGRRPRGEYEQALPELGAIRARAEAHVRYEREKAETAKRLKAAEPSDPISPEKWEAIKAQFRAVLKRRTMP